MASSLPTASQRPSGLKSTLYSPASENGAHALVPGQRVQHTHRGVVTPGDHRAPVRAVCHRPDVSIVLDAPNRPAAGYFGHPREAVLTGSGEKPAVRAERDGTQSVLMCDAPDLPRQQCREFTHRAIALQAVESSKRFRGENRGKVRIDSLFGVDQGGLGQQLPGQRTQSCRPFQAGRRFGFLAPSLLLPPPALARCPAAASPPFLSVRTDSLSYRDVGLLPGLLCLLYRRWSFASPRPSARPRRCAIATLRRPRRRRRPSPPDRQRAVFSRCGA